ncbi:PAS domain-containing sensor histidine kinase [Neisseria leonii]|uniref:PAS domain-containing sensor histidine kinase n=1 Tax=Neisseria leonii TaxID=2995413 RepID=UPI0030CAEA4B
MRLLLAVLSAAAVFGFFMLISAAGNDGLFAPYYWWIVTACGLLMLILLIVVVRYTVLLRRDSRHNMLGSQIARRLAAMFTLVALLPAVFLFGVSAQFISHSINSWFGNDTAQALDSSLNLSKSALNLALDNSVRRATALQVELISAGALAQDARMTVQNSRIGSNFEQLAVYPLADDRTAENLRNPQNLPLPPLENEQRQLLEQSGSVRSVESVNGTLFAQGWLILPARSGSPDALFFRQAIPANVARDAELIEAARSKYAELSYAKLGLQTFFLITLLVASLLAVMLALVVALYFARRFIEPILSLAEGARAVAQGDFSQKRPIYRNDELGRLTKLFNHMTEQLSIARAAEADNRRQQETARRYLETVLESVTAGVMTLDTAGRLKTRNHRADDILGLSLDTLAGRNWRDWPDESPRYAPVAELLAAVLPSTETGQAVQTAYTGSGEAHILLGKATFLPDSQGTVVVFDDITALVYAQKEAAWGEVAKRLAHEIRNPLTPIQLSAERMAWKLKDKLAPEDAQILTRATDTIVKQVAAMKDMVEAFRNYARAPAHKTETLDLNTLIAEVLVLYEGSPCTFRTNFSNIPVFISADGGAMRQVLHNLLKNAAEAAEAAETPAVEVETAENGREVLLSVCNNGRSFSKEMLLHAFEPYVTDKAGGTGLGLPVVRKIIDEHGGKIRLANQSSGGACVRISLPLSMEPA